MKPVIHLAILAACLASLSSVAVAAAASDQVPQRTVHFADLDITNAEGAGALYGRIKDAAKEVCEPQDASNLQQRLFAQLCTAKAIARAVEEVNAPLLRNYHLARTRPAITVAGR